MKNHQKILFALLLSVSIILPPSTSKLDTTIHQVHEYTKYTEETDCLAKNIYYEAGNERFEGKLAVAQVTINRINDPKFPHNMCAVVYQKTHHKNRIVCQFSWTCNDNNKPKNAYRWAEAKYIATRVLTNELSSDIIKNTNARFYHANYINPGWNKHQIVTRIGHHIFYKDIA